jgi:biopolymer transport protein ExbD
MKRISKIVVLLLAFAVGSFAAAVAEIQLIHVAVDPAGKIMVDGRPVAMASLSSTVSSSIKDKEHTVVELKIPENLPPATFDQIKEACRAAGVAKYSIVRIPAPKN